MAASPGGRWATIGLLAAATFLVFMPALTGDFVYDSRLQVLTDPFLHDAANWPAVLSGRVLGMDVLDFNRPAMLASLMLDAAIWGKNPFGYHLTSVLLHVLNVVLVWLLLDRLLVGRAGASSPDAALLTPAVIGALVFAVHPVVTETVCEPSYREDLLVATFTLAALVIALAIAPSRAPVQSRDVTAESATGTAWRVAACVGCALLAVASKESGVVLPPLLLVAWGLFGRNEPRRFWAPAIGGTALVVVAFLAARFLLEPAESRIFGKPVPLGGSLQAALAIQPRILALDAQLILWPFNQSADYQLSSLDHLPLPRSILILVLLTAALTWGARHDRRIGFAAALIVLSILPVANLWPIFQPAADRYLYLPLVGVALIVASVLDRPWWPEGSAARRGAVVAAMVAVALLAVGCVRREAAWHDPVALWQDTARKAPNSFTAAWGLGEALFDAGRPKEAERIARKAVKLSGGEDGGAWATLAVIVADQGRMAEAQSHLSRALAADPLLADPDQRVAALAMERPWAERLKRLLAAKPAAASPDRRPPVGPSGSPPRPAVLFSPGRRPPTRAGTNAMLRHLAGAPLLAVVATIAMLASPLPAAPPKPVATVEGVTEYAFDNGARLVLFPDPSRPTITVNMTVLVGSRHEGYGEAGMAHLLEHLVFKGTPTFPEVPKALRDHGASFNGTTNVDRTNYFETLPASDENLDFAIHLECDRLVNSFIKREDLLSEFTVVRNEFERGENSPERVLSQRVQAAAYEWHNYGKSTIGNRSDIERVPIENLRDFYERFYQPDNVVLIVTGKFEPAKALELATKYLGSIPKPTRRLNATYTEEPAQDGERTVILRRVGKVGALMAAYHMPASAHADWAPLSMLASILSEDKIGRLEKNLVEPGIATSATAFADDAHDPGLFSFMAQPAEGNLEETETVLLGIADKVGETPFTAEELDRAKVRAKRGYDNAIANAASMAQALSSAAALGDWRLWFLQRDRISATTIDDVNRVAKTYFHPHNRTVGIFIPADAPQRLAVPAVESIADLVKDYKGGSAVEAGEEFDPSPENIEARTRVIDLDGVKVALLPKKNRGETVTFSLTLHYGNEQSLAGLATASGILPSLLMAGTSKYDRQQLRQKFDELGVRIGGGGRRGGRGGSSGGAGVLSFGMEAKRATLPEAIRLLGEVLRDPAFPADELEQMRAQSLAGLAQMQSEPQMLAGVALGRALSDYPKGDVRYARTVEENIADLKAVSLDDVKTLWRDQLAAASGEVVIVGDFDSEAAVAEVREALAGWKSTTPYERIDRTVKADVTGAKDDILTPDKANAVFTAGLAFPLDDDSPDEVALEIGNFILGGGALSSRLGDRIRQKEGLSYGVTSSVSVPSRGDDARFTINAITNPANIDAVETAALEELKRFLQSGPSEQELSDAKTAWLEARKTGRSSDGSIAGQLAANLDLGRTFARVAEDEKRVEALTPQQVQDAFRRHIDPDKLIIIRAGDFKK